MPTCVVCKYGGEGVLELCSLHLYNELHKTWVKFAKKNRTKRRRVFWNIICVIKIAKYYVNSTLLVGFEILKNFT